MVLHLSKAVNVKSQSTALAGQFSFTNPFIDTISVKNDVEK